MRERVSEDTASQLGERVSEDNALQLGELSPNSVGRTFSQLSWENFLPTPCNSVKVLPTARQYPHFLSLALSS